MSVGSFGNIRFVVSQKQVYSFNNFKRNITSNWKEHERYGKKPVSEFVSPGLQEITFTIQLEASLGVKPRQQLEKWRKICETGLHDILVVGNEQIGKYEWKVEKISEAWNTIFSQGELISAELSITMSEYVNDIIVKSANKVTKKATSSPKLSTPKAASSVNVGATYKVKTILTGYYTALEAKNQKATNRTGKVYPGTYYVFNKSDGMINVTKVKGSPGSWINPSKNK